MQWSLIISILLVALFFRDLFGSPLIGRHRHLFGFLRTTMRSPRHVGVLSTLILTKTSFF